MIFGDKTLFKGNEKQKDLVVTLFSVWIFVGPFLALLGNTGSDIWLTAIAVLFLAFCAYRADWQWCKLGWIKLVALFWVWMLLTAGISAWPGHSLTEPPAWLRFPLFAVGFSSLLVLDARLSKSALISMVLGVLTLSTILLVERWNNPDAVRLWGTWGQNTKPGWYMLGLGLPVSLWALGQAFGGLRKALWAVPLLLLIIFATITTGEIYVSLSLGLGLSIYLLLSILSMPSTQRYFVSLAIGGAIVTAISTAMIVPAVANRFIWSLTTRLPWLESSDYHIPWMRGFETWRLNPLMGVGPNNFDKFCEVNERVLALGPDWCFPHPHQLYIQIAGETGFIGLLLFVAIVVALLKHVLKANSIKQMTPQQMAAVSLLVVAFWPISTYSEAFGQHKNYFTWLMIGWALYLAKQGPSDRKNGDDRPLERVKGIEPSS